MPATDYRESLSTLVPIALASRYYPRDAMLVRVLAMALCPCLCLCPSITSRCSVETNGQNVSGFWHGGFFRPVLHWHFPLELFSKLRT